MTRILTIIALLFATPALALSVSMGISKQHTRCFVSADGCQQEGDGYFWPAKPPHKPLKH